MRENVASSTVSAAARAWQNEMGTVDEGGFDQNFTQNFVWYEWGFVSPGDMPSHERPPGASDRANADAPSVPEVWDEDHRWPT